MAEKYPLLIEIGCEDLPPSEQSLIQKTGEGVFKNILNEKGIKHGRVKVMTSPRRIALKVLSLSSHTSSDKEKIKGPPAPVAFKNGKPTAAGEGFAGKMGVKFNSLHKEKTSRGEYYFFIRKEPGRPVRKMLDEIIKEFLLNLNLNQRMRWPGGEIKFVRPIRWLVVKMGSRGVKFKFGSLTSISSTRGHYAFADRKVSINNIKNYEDVLERNYVVVDHVRRKELLLRALKRPLKHTMGYLVENKTLLEEVNNSLEYPTGIKGKFPEKYLKLPRLIIEACLVYHQKYFPVEDKEGNILNYFVAARDGISEYLQQIRKGYEKVLIARLEDAAFFLEKDRRKSLREHLETLNGIEFTRGLGTLYDKVKRIELLSERVAKQLKLDEKRKKTILEIARLCKADLGTGIVGEFPELEAKAGAVYAKMDSEDKKVCAGIAQHLMPADFKDAVPALDEAAVAGIADRMDTIAGNIGKGVRASGSQDPFALRRSCRGMVKILINKSWFVDISKLIKEAVGLYNRKKKLLPESAQASIEEFVLAITKQMLEEKYPHDTARCVISGRHLDPAASFHKALAIEKIRKGKGFDSLVAAFKRINNILKQAREENFKIPAKFDGRILKDKEEKKLSRLLRNSEKKVKSGIEKNNYQEVLKILISLKDPIDGFFDNVLVMDRRDKVRKNRLALLKNILELFSPVGDISKLEIKNTDA